MTQQNQPLRRLQYAVDNFNQGGKVDLSELETLEIDIQKLLTEDTILSGKDLLQDSRGLSPVQEKLLTARRVAQRLQNRLRELDTLRQMVAPVDQDLLELLVSDIESRAAKGVLSFAEFQSVAKQELSRRASFGHPSSSFAPTSPSPQAGSSSQGQQSSTLLPLDPLLEARRVESEMSRLAGDIDTVQHVMTDLSKLTKDQRDHLDSVEDHVETSLEATRQGNRLLASAGRLKAAVLPITGALIGCAVGGPVGLFIGLKAGAAVGFFGGALGYAGGKMVKKGNNAVTTEAEKDEVARLESKEGVAMST